MIALVDCNNFFASCERLFRPDLAGKPVLVLSNNDGCVVARSNEVRELGVPMGVPYFQIKQLVEKNNVHCFSSNFALYSNISQRVFGVLEQHAAQIEVYSIDEAFMQLNDILLHDALSWGERLRREVQKSIGIPVSVGVAPTKTLAKLASAYAKKRQQTCVLNPEDKTAFQTVLETMKVDAVWGVGRRLAPRLHAAGIHTAWQLACTHKTWLHSHMGVNGTHLFQELNGVVSHPFESTSTPQKSLMVSRSFGHTLKNIHELESAVANFASRAAFQLRQHKQNTRSFGIYLRYRQPDGATKGASARVALPVPTNNTVELVHTALDILRSLYDPENGYKKAGVYANQLESSQISQTHLFDPMSLTARKKQKELMKALDTINVRFGSETIFNASVDPRLAKWHGKKERMSPAYTTDWNQLPLVYSAA